MAQLRLKSIYREIYPGLSCIWEGVVLINWLQAVLIEDGSGLLADVLNRQSGTTIYLLDRVGGFLDFLLHKRLKSATPQTCLQTQHTPTLQHQHQASIPKPTPIDYRSLSLSTPKNQCPSFSHSSRWYWHSVNFPRSQLYSLLTAALDFENCQ